MQSDFEGFPALIFMLSSPSSQAEGVGPNGISSSLFLQCWRSGASLAGLEGSSAPPFAL